MSGDTGVLAETAAPTSDELMRQINDLGIGTPEYHEALWFLFSVLARKQYAIADRLRADRRKRERAAETRRRNREQSS